MTLTIKINHRKLLCGFQVGGENHIWYVNLWRMVNDAYKKYLKH